MVPSRMSADTVAPNKPIVEGTARKCNVAWPPSRLRPGSHLAARRQPSGGGRGCASEIRILLGGLWPGSQVIGVKDVHLNLEYL